jgi:hypothetical protein
MYPVGLFVSFSHAIGFNPFMLAVFIIFMVLLLPKINNPLVFAILALSFAGIVLAKTSIVDLFLLWTFELTIIMIGFYVLVKNPNTNGLWFWLGLGFLAFVW